MGSVSFTFIIQKAMGEGKGVKSINFNRKYQSWSNLFIAIRRGSACPKGENHAPSQV